MCTGEDSHGLSAQEVQCEMKRPALYETDIITLAWIPPRNVLYIRYTWKSQTLTKKKKKKKDIFYMYWKKTKKSLVVLSKI